MRNIFALRMKVPRGLVARRQWRPRLLATLLIGVVAAAMAFAPGMFAEQSSGAAHKTISETKKPAVHKRKGSPRIDLVASQAPQAPATPAPQWPVDDPPEQASVVWSAQGLSIDARNSSLQDILKEISARIGTKIEGIGKDERVFGVYGPGQPRDVLSQLLEGTGYNVLMVGDKEQGVPQQIVLSVRPKGGPQPNAPVNPSDMYQPPTTPYRPPEPIMRPNETPRTPQQILQEMEQRQQQLREEQLRQQQMRGDQPTEQQPQ